MGPAHLTHRLTHPASAGSSPDLVGSGPARPHLEGRSPMATVTLGAPAMAACPVARCLSGSPSTSAPTNRRRRPRHHYRTQHAAPRRTRLRQVRRPPAPGRPRRPVPGLPPHPHRRQARRARPVCRRRQQVHRPQHRRRHRGPGPHHRLPRPAASPVPAARGTRRDNRAAAAARAAGSDPAGVDARGDHGRRAEDSGRPGARPQDCRGHRRGRHLPDHRRARHHYHRAPHRRDIRRHKASNYRPDLSPGVT
jgi:hypothetical protein